MLEWIIFFGGIVVAIQTFGILGAIRQAIKAWQRKTDTQTEAIKAAIEYQNIVWAAALEKDNTPPSFGKN